MRRYIFILSLLFPFLSMVAQPKHEVRAAWVTAVYGLDWPRTRATTPQTIRKQKEELIDILDKLKAANFNTVLFQTRTRGDVLYPSACCFARKSVRHQADERYLRPLQK